jgi:phage-related protein
MVDRLYEYLDNTSRRDKPLGWLGSSRSDLRAFPVLARRMAGFQLRRVQQGLEPYDWKPMKSVGPGIREIRIRTGLEHRVFYVATLAEAVFVLHAFEKRTSRTPKADLDVARKRHSVLIAGRKG